MSKATKGLAILGLASAVAFAGPAFAQDTGFYAGLSFGQSSADFDCSGLITCDDQDTAWKILGGYRFNRNLAVEFGYTDLGEGSGSDGVDTATIESTAFEVVAVGSFPIANNFSVYGKAGFFRGDTEATVTGTSSGSVSESNTDLTYGVGVQYDFNRNLGVRGEWQRYTNLGGENIDEFDVDVISVGLIWRF
jgi:OOP family OmpA-OmpF porin